ncbi:MAG: DNA polymerase III subunit gamma/tau [Proteobacteria bacterium]|nr:DNA polymerase III subunit gamma/tau [Pseudomonadota bacterium]MBU4326567.1 DNA polymerase III subunit gamma/tau [Pseudomonadota bacterium]
MSYLVLARKARPQTFDEVVGQRPVVKTLQNSLLRDRVAHAILFSGVRGVGKTTLARIMAKAINCEQGPAENPCNVCESCRTITAGSSIDLYEIDGASNRGIQEIRELKEKIRFLPTSSRYKIIIIDEVHMLTTEAFNALLKTLEEPPAHVYFMFATTELHKIPITILSRCQRYELKRVAPIDMSGHLQKLAEAEGVQIEQGALDLIVREADGSVRDGLSLLDQVFSFGEKNISTDDVIQVLGLVSREVVLKLTKALLEQDPATAFQSLEEIFSFGMDLKRFITDLLGCFRALILCKIKGCDELLDVSQQELTLFQELAGNHSSQTLHMKLTLLMQGVEEMRYSSQPRLAMETTFLKIIQSSDVTPVTTLLSRLDSLLAGAGETGQQSSQAAAQAGGGTSGIVSSMPKKKQPFPPVAEQEIVCKQIVEVQSPQEEKPAVSAAPVETPSQAEVEEDVSEEENSLDGTSTLPPELKGSPDETPAPRIEPHQRSVRRDWMEFIAYVRDRSVWMSQDLQRADSAKEQGGELLLHYVDPANCSMLRKEDTKKLITEFTLDFFQKELTVRFVIPDQNSEATQDGQESPLKERHLLANDPLVLMTAEIFNGQIGDIRVGPRFR